MATAADVRDKLGKDPGVDATLVASITDATLAPEPARPGTYRGNHFFDLGSEFLWRSDDQGHECGETKWFTATKKSGDRAERGGRCPSGLDWYTSSLVA